MGLNIAAMGGQAVAAALILVGSLRFLRWLIEFVAKQLHDRADRLVERELAVERRMNKRLEHVELELDCYREATMILINALAAESPSNRALADAAKILRKIPPRATLELDELEERLNSISGGHIAATA